jgi:hypothetical protein
VDRNLMRQTSLIDATWVHVRDGNPSAMELFLRHYTARQSRRVFKFVGPGEHIVLMTPTADALFVWRKERYRKDSQTGVNCAVFRNEGPQLSSALILAADEIAWERWPGERLYTFVNPAKTRHKRDPGRCFLRAGWRHCGWSAKGLRILETLPGWIV